jgi:MYXO-CTERM domain-containing protein
MFGHRYVDFCRAAALLRCWGAVRWAVFMLGAVGTSFGLAGCVDVPTPEELNVTLDPCVLANDGDLCDDHQVCTYPDRCFAKKCVGTPVADGTPCTDSNLCTTGDRCVAAVCVGTVVLDGTSCMDGDPCTDPDICQAGICQSGPAITCDDGDACTLDTCTPGIGCIFSPRECTMPVDAAVDTFPDVGTDTVPDGISLDTLSPDTADAIAVDGGAADVVVDAPAAVDAVDGTEGVDASADAGAADAKPDVRDAALDLVETPPDLRVRGGGCQCALGGADARGVTPVALPFALSLLAVMALRRRRKG